MLLKSKSVNDLKMNQERMMLASKKMSYIGVLDEETNIDIVPFKIVHSGQVIETFNPLFSMLKVNDFILNLRFFDPTSFEQSYDVERDIYHRLTTYKVQGASVHIESERFIDHEHQVLCCQYKFYTSQSMSVDLYQGINCELEPLLLEKKDVQADLHHINIFLRERSLHLSMMYSKDFSHKNYNDDQESVEHYKIKTEANRVYTLVKFVAFGEDYDEVTERNQKFINQDYKDLRNNHIQRQIEAFGQHRVEVVANRKTQDIIDYSTRYLMNMNGRFQYTMLEGLRPILPFYFYLLNDTTQAKQHLIAYINRLSEAMDKADELGYIGALYVDDQDDFSFGSHHIMTGAIIVKAMDEYIKFTKDLSILKHDGIKMLISICDFYMDYSVYDEEKRHYSILNVANLDHSTQHIDNHSLTNHLVFQALKMTKSMIRLGQENPDIKIILDGLDYQNKMKQFSNFQQRLYVMQPNVNHYIMPYEDFADDLKNHLLKELRHRVLIAGDHLLIFVLFRDDFSETTIKANVEHFGNLLRDTMINEVFLSLVKLEETSDISLNHLLNFASVKGDSLINKHKLDIVMMAVVYYMMVFRFSGLELYKSQFIADTLLPNDIRRLEFNMNFMNRQAQVKIKRNSARIEWRKEEQ